mgnify:CR=1 FL=1
MVTDLWWRIDQAVKNAISEEAIEGVNNVASQLSPDVSALTNALFPAIIVSEEGVIPKLLNRTSAAVDREYPVRVWLVDNTPTHAKKETYLGILSAVVNLFDGKRLDGVDEVQFGRADYEVAYNPSLPAGRGYVASATRAPRSTRNPWSVGSHSTPR